MQILGQRIVHELQAWVNPEAEEIANLLGGALPSGSSTETPAPQKRPILPTHCPSCGAAVKPGRNRMAGRDYRERPIAVARYVMKTKF